ncbi:response regulator transcription factor [Clostridium botulinum]|uniref:Stage 0 sporulation protein A homolog n=1 Tax=Clostridium botulinum TaxID=1491 RepID=A0A9Q1ZB57_CLOBO|nr:response regulator transcription factor [Clostridium botulinum]AEB75161.1 two-component response regulator [Clostridium botulinum BKT015925]KEI02846.1 regulator [Clostridium botulinum C/D str. Sp77]KEI03380.1 regulator [Clostridium botulinum D str. 16868]KLU75138.1 regulator [Clostridium botulinum V891]KOA72883.1 regulator [Clostridium botulinum]
MKGRVLVIEDDIEIASIIRKHLTRENYDVNWSSTGSEGLKDFNKDKYDLVILDIMLPEMDGFMVCKNIRLISNVPILILSAKKQELDKVKGLKLGADDYITKPFSLIELEARVENNIKRYKGDNKKSQKQDVWSYKQGLKIIKDEMRVTVNDDEIELTAKEFALLVLMAQNENKVFTKKDLYENIWHQNNLEGNNTITVHIKELRQKIKEDVKHPQYIQTVWGTGYKFIGEKV